MERQELKLQEIVKNALSCPTPYFTYGIGFLNPTIDSVQDKPVVFIRFKHGVEFDTSNYNYMNNNCIDISIPIEHMDTENIILLLNYLLNESNFKDLRYYEENRTFRMYLKQEIKNYLATRTDDPMAVVASLVG